LKIEIGHYNQYEISDHIVQFSDHMIKSDVIRLQYELLILSLLKMMYCVTRVWQCKRKAMLK